MILITATKDNETERMEFSGMWYAMMTVQEFVSRGYTVTVSEVR